MSLVLPCSVLVAVVVVGCSGSRGSVVCSVVIVGGSVVVVVAWVSH